MPCDWEGLASHWPRVTNISSSPLMGSRPGRGDEVHAEIMNDSDRRNNLQVDLDMPILVVQSIQVPPCTEPNCLNLSHIELKREFFDPPPLYTHILFDWELPNLEGNPFCRRGRFQGKEQGGMASGWKFVLSSLIHALSVWYRATSVDMVTIYSVVEHNHAPQESVRGLPLLRLLVIHLLIKPYSLTVC